MIRAVGVDIGSNDEVFADCRCQSCEFTVEIDHSLDNLNTGTLIVFGQESLESVQLRGPVAEESLQSRDMGGGGIVG